jgi:hypothetical protein
MRSVRMLTPPTTTVGRITRRIPADRRDAGFMNASSETSGIAV